MINTVLLEGFYTDDLEAFPAPAQATHLFIGPKPSVSMDDGCLSIIFETLPQLENFDADYRAGKKINSDLYLKARANTLDAIYHDPQYRRLYSLCQNSQAALRHFEYTDRIAAYLLATQGVRAVGGENYMLRRDEMENPKLYDAAGNAADQCPDSTNLVTPLRDVISLAKDFAVAAGYFTPEPLQNNGIADPAHSLNVVLPYIFGLDAQHVNCAIDDKALALMDYEQFAVTIIKPLYQQATDLHGSQKVEERLSYFLNMFAVCQPQQLSYKSFIKDFIPSVIL